MSKSAESSFSTSSSTAAAGLPEVEASYVSCPSCSSKNPAQARYCNLCGGALAASLTPADSDGSHHSISEEIDARRARQLLDRALHLAERGDLAAAILACRQSVALAPHSINGHSMLGMLLDRTGDTIHAIQSYERVLQMAPASSLEREALIRLREKQISAGGGNNFNFNEGELFSGGGAPPNTIPPATPIPESTLEGAPDLTTALEAGAAAELLAPSQPGIPAPAGPTTETGGHAEPSGSSAGVSAANLGTELTSQLAAGVTAAEAISASETEAAPPAERRSGPSGRSRDRRATDRRNTPVPVAVERRRTSERRGPESRAPRPETAAQTVMSHAAVPPMGPVSLPPAGRIATPQMAPRDGRRGQRAASPYNAIADSPLDFPHENLGASPWRTTLGGPTFFARGWPLAGATIVSVAFLVWAGSVAGIRMANSPEAAAGSQTAPQPKPQNLAQNPPPGADPNTAARPVVNPATNTPSGTVPKPITGAQPGTFPIENRVITVRNGGSTSADRTTGASRSNALPAPAIGAVPRFPAGQVAPAAGPPASGSGGISLPSMPAVPSGNGASGLGSIPAPRIDQGGPPTVFQPVLPPGDNSGAAPSGGASSGGAPLNPAGAPAPGYIRINQGRIPASAAPSRPAAAARGDETRAAASARGGQTDAAIGKLTSAMNNTDNGEVGFLYQQRATLFLQRGDYSRAADDFQTAISAYTDQITRGDDLAAAKAGLRASRSGFNLAVSKR